MVEASRRTYSVVQAGEVLGLSRGAAYEAAKQGELPILKISKRIVVPIVALERMLESATVREAE